MIEEVAWHEGGHCAAYLANGLVFGWVRIGYDNSGKLVGSVNAPAARYAPFVRAVICCSGPVVEFRLTGVPPRRQPDSAHDLRMAMDALGRVGRSDRLNEAMNVAAELCATNWRAITMIAARLISRGQLSYGQIVDLVQPSSRESQWPRRLPPFATPSHQFIPSRAAWC
jgi:hypothetical protein